MNYIILFGNKLVTNFGIVHFGTGEQSVLGIRKDSSAMFDV